MYDIIMQHHHVEGSSSPKVIKTWRTLRNAKRHLRVIALRESLHALEMQKEGVDYRVEFHPKSQALTTGIAEDDCSWYTYAID